MSLNRTIRLFVSSTFSDLKAERNVLQEHVFPRLKQLCLTRGFRFQAIDLRWGISEEAGRDNKTMRICLRELRRCQQDRPKPNFLILLGDRYGWRPLPEIIPAGLFEKLAAQLEATDPDAAQLLQQSYRIDNNAVPPAAELQPRGDNESWHDRVAKPLLSALEQAAQALGLDLEQAGVSIGASATEQEIIEGALRVPDAATHVCTFFRTIDGLPDDPPPRDFVDAGEPQARPRLEALKRRIQDHLGNDNVCHYRVPWRGNGIDAKDLKGFCDLAWKHLSEVVEKQIFALTEVPPEVQEEQAHQDFGAERCRHFVGREEPLRKIADYLSQGSDAPLALVGPSGSGKSAVMARAAQVARETNPKAQVIARFIGATPASSDLIQLLRNVVAEIRKRYPAPVAAQAGPTVEGEVEPGDAEIPFEFDPLVSAFYKVLTRPIAEQPLYLFLDSLDQLTASHQAHALNWLPSALSEHARLVVSAALPPEDAADAPVVGTGTNDPRRAVMAALVSKLETSHQVPLAPLTIADGEEMLTNLLADAGRTLQSTQCGAILRAFQAEGSPLWLRTATEEAARLTDWDPVPSFQPTTPGLLGQVLSRLSQPEEHGELLVSHTLGYLACARHGLAEDEILDVLSADLEVMGDFVDRSPTERFKPETDRVKTLPVAVWVRLHGDLAFYLAEHRAQGVSLLGFYHRSFQEAVTARGLVASYPAFHRTLARYFASKADPSGDGSWSSDSPRDVGETVHHHVAGFLWDDVKQILCSLQFIAAKCRVGLAYDLARDYEEAISAFPGGADWEREAGAKQSLAQYARGLLLYAEAHTRARATATVCHSPLPQLDWEASGATGATLVDAGPILEPMPAFEQFVRGSTAVLDEHRAMPGFCVQHAYNSMNAGAVARAAEQTLRDPSFSCPALLRAEASRRPYDERPALSRTLHAHSHVSSLSLTPDGCHIVSGGQDGTLRIWEVRTGLALKTVPMTSPYYHVDGLAVTADVRIAVTAPDMTDKALRVWNLQDGVEIGIGPLVGHAGGINSIAATPDGGLLASGSSDKTVRIWDLADGKCVQTLDAGEEVLGVHISPDGLLVTALAKKAAIVWETANRRVVSRVSFGSEYRRLAVSLDSGTGILAGGKNVAVWNVEGETIAPLGGSEVREYVNAVAITPNGAFGAYGGNDRTLRVFDVRTRRELRSYRAHSQPITTLSLRADGQLAVSGSADGTIRLWDTSRESTPPIDPELLGKVRSLAIDRPDKVALCQRENGKVRYYMLSSGQDMTFFDTPGLAIGADARFCFSRSGNAVQGWDMSTGRRYTFVTDEIPTSADSKYPILSLSTLRIAAAAPRAISAGADRIWIWDLLQGVCTSDLPVPGKLRALAVSDDGRFAAGAGGQNTKDSDRGIRVWDLVDGRLLHTIAQEDSINALSFTPDCRGLVAGGDQGILHLWHVASGRLMRTIGGKRSWVTEDRSLGNIGGIVITQDGRKALVVDSETLRICDLREATAGPPLRHRTKHSELRATVLITEDARYAMAGVGDTTLRVWEIASGRCLLVTSEQAELVQLNAMSDSVAVVDTDGNALFATLRNLVHGPAILTAGSSTAGSCPMCGKDVVTPSPTQQVIAQYEGDAHRGITGCPSLDLPPDAWCNPRLDGACGACGQALRFNPFYASSS